MGEIHDISLSKDSNHGVREIPEPVELISLEPGNEVANAELETAEMMNSDLLGDESALCDGSPLFEDILGDTLFGDGDTEFGADFNFPEELPDGENITVDNQDKVQGEREEVPVEGDDKVGARKRLFQKAALLNGISSKKRNILTLASPRKLIRGGVRGVRPKEGTGKIDGEKSSQVDG